MSTKAFKPLLNDDAASDAASDVEAAHNSAGKCFSERMLKILVLISALSACAMIAGLAVLYFTNQEGHRQGAYDAFFDENVDSILDSNAIDRAKLDAEFDKALGKVLNKQRPRIGEEFERTEAESELDQLESDAIDDTEKDSDMDMEAMLAEAMLARELKTASDFVRRFPREQHRKIRFLRQTHDLPRRIKARSTPIHDSPRNRVSELISHVDTNLDGGLGPWELHDWMLLVERIVQRHVVDEQWAGLGRNASFPTLGWSDYQAQLNPFGARSLTDKRRMTADRRRWEHADADHDNILSKREFKVFIFPQLRQGGAGVLVQEAHSDLDSDWDGRVSRAEFLAAHRSDAAAADFFNRTLDADADGYLDVLELAQWAEPKGYSQVKSEVVYLMETLDLDGDHVLRLGGHPQQQQQQQHHQHESDVRDELLSDGGTAFLTSQVTYYGELYRLDHLREEVFQYSWGRRRK